jgi:hypothetical protein
MTPPRTLWRPTDEASAGSTLAVLIEWLRATGRRDGATPEDVRNWRRTEGRQFLAALADFAGLDAAREVQANLLRFRGNRVALVASLPDGRRHTWTREALRSGQELPCRISTFLAHGSRQDLHALAECHLLASDTRPDDRIQWLGDAADPWPLGAWIVGAAVVLGGPAEPGARVFAARPPDWSA